MLRQSIAPPTNPFTRKTSLLAATLALVSLVTAGCEVRRVDQPAARPEFLADTLREEGRDPIEAVPGPDPSDSRTLEQRLSDASVSAHVKLALVEERRLRRFEIEPEVQDGVVSLLGEVSSSEDRSLAEQVARGVKGVRSVRNVLDVPGMAALADSAAPPMAGAPIDTTAARPAPPDTATARPAPSSEVTAPAASSSDDEEYYTVRSGDSLWEIARRHGTTVDAIRRLNNLQADRLRPGDRLRVR